MRKMSWWSVFLHEELEEDGTKLTELRALIKSAGMGLVLKPTPPKKVTTEPDYGPVAAKLMAMMGYKAGMGLGKIENGIKEPIIAKPTNFIGSSSGRCPKNPTTDNNRAICFVRQVIDYD